MYEIDVAAAFTAAHAITLPGGAVETPHDHTWQLVVTLAAPNLDPLGLVADFTLVQRRLADLAADLQSQNLNTLLAPANPTAENLARHIHDRLAPRLPPNVALAAVTLQEAPGCWARYRPDRPMDACRTPL